MVDRRKQYARARRRRYGAQTQESRGWGRLVLLAAVISLVVVVRFSGSERMVQLRQGLSDAFHGGGGYKEAVSVIGRAIAGEDDGKENAVLVFGKKLLGIEDEPEPEDQKPADEPQKGGADDGVEPEDNVLNETAPEDALEGTKAGDISGFSFETVCESPLPESVSAANLSLYLSAEEDEDPTPNEPFEIPSPDKVDDTIYKLPFKYKRPLRGTVTSEFGYRIHPISGETTFHYAADVGVAKGSTVSSFADGTVAETGSSTVYGYYVKINHPDGFMSFYAHLSKIVVKKGDKVKLGQKVALSGSTGWSTGPHLHFELRRNGLILNPFDYISFK